MNGILTSLIAVFATLAGSALTFLFQRHAAQQAEQFSREQRLWHERIAAYSDFAAAVTDFRRSQNDRWHAEQADPRSPQTVAASEASYQRRADATGALCRVQLVCGEPELSRLAQEAVDATTHIHTAHDERDRAGRGEEARLALQRFLAAASPHVR
ncbi:MULTISPECIES: hypothetical protein [Streptomyces]|uniref:hypothetical protein n=1 Tax=Streptomyces TaxID=1883 RepID=UPI000EAD8D29|nr:MULTISPECIES: hypothetical protein [Streptomyces]